jgi:hypothetical protein
MDNDQNICQNSTDDIEVTSKVKNNDFHKFWVRGNDGFDYAVAMHKSVCLLNFIKIAENTTGSQMSGYRIWVDSDSHVRYQILDQDHMVEAMLVPAEFVRIKYGQVIYHFKLHEGVKDKLQAGAEDLKLQELKSESDFHVNRLMKLLFHDLENIEHIAEITENKLTLTFGNIANNNVKLIADLIKDDDKWLYLKFDSDSYYLDESDGLQGTDDVLYFIGCHRTLKHITFVRIAKPEFHTAAVHHLHISEDDGLGRYKVQTREGEILEQFFVPVGYVESCHDIFRELFDDFKMLQHESDVCSRQTRWCKLQDDSIHLINQILGELKSDLKPEIENSLEHYVMLMPFSSVIRNPRNFDESLSAGMSNSIATSTDCLPCKNSSSARVSFDFPGLLTCLSSPVYSLMISAISLNDM